MVVGHEEDADMDTRRMVRGKKAGLLHLWAPASSLSHEQAFRACLHTASVIRQRASLLHLLNSHLTSKVCLLLTKSNDLIWE